MAIQQSSDQLLELALFAGGGGGILGGKLLGWRCIGAVEIEGYPRGILAQRQNDGCLDPFPIWDDILTFRSDNPECAEFFAFLKRIRHRLVISGGFPCQDISVAGAGAGIEGERSGLWKEYARVVREIGPAYVWVENSPALVIRGLGTVLKDLDEMGYDARWGVFSAADSGARHERERIWSIQRQRDGITKEPATDSARTIHAGQHGFTTDFSTKRKRVTQTRIARKRSWDGQLHGQN